MVSAADDHLTMQADVKAVNLVQVLEELEHCDVGERNFVDQEPTLPWDVLDC
jgi:hypothetical protein